MREKFDVSGLNLTSSDASVNIKHVQTNNDNLFLMSDEIKSLVSDELVKKTSDSREQSILCRVTIGEINVAGILVKARASNRQASVLLKIDAEDVIPLLNAELQHVTFDFFASKLSSKIERFGNVTINVVDINAQINLATVRIKVTSK